MPQNVYEQPYKPAKTSYIIVIQKIFSILGIISILICILIIMIFAPSVLTSARTGNESIALTAVLDLSNIEKEYKEHYGKYGNLTELHKANLIDETLASGKVRWYLVRVIVKDNTFEIYANPTVHTGRYTLNERGGHFSFYINEKGVLHCNSKGIDASEQDLTFEDRYKDEKMR